MFTTNYAPFVIFIVIVLVFARRPLAASDASGTQFDMRYMQAAFHTDSPKTSPPILTVASFNIQTGKSNEGKRNITRSALSLQSVDLAGVQEVYASTWLNELGLGSGQNDVLASTGGFAFLFSPTVKRWFKEHRGNSILSRLPVTKWKTTMLPDQSGKSFRNYTVVEMDWLGEPFVFINTHLHTSRGKDEQLKQLIEEFDRHPRVILTGDFNTRRDSDLLIELLSRGDVSDAIGELQIDPQESDRIDWIITRGFTPVEGHFEPRGVSDHPYYQVDLRLNLTAD